MNIEMMNIFLEGLSKEYKGRKIILIMDNESSHSSKDFVAP